MNENEQIFMDLQDIYEKNFGDRFVIPEPSYLGIEDGIEIMKECIKTGKPYEYPELPKGCVA